MKALLEGISILIVDDEEELREILAEEFAALGAIVRTASGGNEAYAMFETEASDVILSDVRMSGGNGIELLKKVRSKCPKAPPYFFLLTGFAEKEQVLQIAGENGESVVGQELITKPFSLKALQERVAAVCVSLK